VHFLSLLFRNSFTLVRSRWLRLLFTREFGIPDALLLWDGLFACDPTLELAKWICVAMLIRIRNQRVWFHSCTSFRSDGSPSHPFRLQHPTHPPPPLPSASHSPPYHLNRERTNICCTPFHTPLTTSFVVANRADCGYWRLCGLREPQFIEHCFRSSRATPTSHEA
jgi:hypothetical protein